MIIADDIQERKFDYSLEKYFDEVYLDIKRC